jgi:hypothetical protein
MKSDKFTECATCINKELDPFQCRSCVSASGHETEMDDIEHLSYHELIELVREEE